MIYLLILFLIFFIFTIYIMNHFEIISISFISTAMFILSITIVIINNTVWKFEISYKTLWIIILGLFTLFLGEMLSRLFYASNRKVQLLYISSPKGNIKTQFYVSNLVYIISLFFILIDIIAYYLTIRNASQFGTGTTMLAAYRNAIVKNKYSINPIVTLMYNIGYWLSLIYLYLFINDKKKPCKYLFFIILSFIPIIISSGRSKIIHFVTSAVILYYFSESKKNFIKQKKLSMKIIKIGLLVLISYVLLFYFLGNLTAKSSLYNNIFENLSMYLGSSICALDEFVNNFKYSSKNIGESFFAVINFMKKFGIEIFNIKSNYLPYTYFPLMKHQTNIYTFLRREINDFGFLGMCLINVMIGYIYTKIFLKIKKNKYKRNEEVELLYAAFFYPVVLVSIDFKFFDIISLTSVIEIIFIIFMFRFVLRRKHYVCE